MTWQAIHQSYPINSHQIWLNNSGTTPPGNHIVARMAEHFRQLAAGGPENTCPSRATVEQRIKTHLAEVINASLEDIALIHNTSEGMNMLSLGLTLVPGDEILLLENEYPNNVYPWQRFQSAGVNVNFVPVGRSSEEFLDSFKKRLNSRTRVVALSMVHWCTGMPLPYQEVAQLCEERGIFFALDGAQGIGQVPFDFAACSPIALCFSAWKWLLGPLGVGVLVASRSTVAKLHSPFRGTDSVTNPASYLPYQTEQKQTVDRYCYSTANTNDWVYFDESLKFLSEVGFARVYARIIELTKRLWEPLRDAGFTSGYDHGSTPLTGILCVEKPGVNMSRVADALVSEGIIARLRLGRIRLAPHVYLLEEQIDHATTRLIDLCR